MSSVRSLLLILLMLALGGCQIEGGTPRPTLAGTAGAPAATSAPATPATPAPAETTLRIGLIDEPDDLLPYHTNAADERITAPVSQLLFPAPLLTVNYALTGTGVLERIPSRANGDVELRPVEVYLDTTGAITSTVTEVITQVQQIVVTYRWNPDLRWSDGTPVTADDSLFAYELAQRVTLGEVATNSLAITERYERVDAHTTRAFLNPDYAGQAYLQTFWTPLPRHLLSDVAPEDLALGDFAARPIGYGPYMLEARSQGLMRLRRNPHYTGPAPSAETVSFVFLNGVDALRSSVAGGSLDLAVTDRVAPEQLALLAQDRDQGRLAFSAIPGPIWEHLDFNLDIPLLQEIRVRRAIAHALNRQGLIDSLLGGQTAVLESWVMPGDQVAAPPDTLTRYPFDQERARQLLDEVGLTDNDGDGIREVDGQPLTLSLLTTEGMTLRSAIAAQLTTDLQSVGITVTVEALPSDEFYASDGPLFRRSFQLAQFAWIAGSDPGGLSLWSCAAVPSEKNGWVGNNFSGWCFREADQLIRTANTTIDQDERKTAYLRHQQLYTQELPTLPLFQRPILTLHAPDLHGVEPDPLAPITWNIERWTRE